jgi:cyclic pyranopterin phosphate synthase
MSFASVTGTIRRKIFTHANGMVDVSSKRVSNRSAVASCSIEAPQRIVNAIFSPAGTVNNKGNVIQTARIAGIMGSKKTSDLIPLCHQIPLSHVSLEISRLSPTKIGLTSRVKTHNQTGVEMEALTAVSIAALTVYDMSKSALKGTSDRIVITDISLDSKTITDSIS